MTDRYADADPEECGAVVGVGPMTLRSAVKGYVAAREKVAEVRALQDDIDAINRAILDEQGGAVRSC